MNENEQVTLNFRDQVGVDKLEEAPSSSLNLSPPSSPIRQEFVRFHSNSPGLKSLNDYYAFDLLPNVPEISKCVKTTDPLCPVNDTMADIEDCVQYFTAFCKVNEDAVDEAYESGTISEISSEMCLEFHESDVTLEKMEKIHKTISSGHVQRETQTNISFLAKNREASEGDLSINEPDRKRSKLH